MFTDCVRVVTLAANGAGIKKRAMEGYLCNMVQISPGMGAKDPRLDVLSKINFRLSRQLCSYALVDPPPDRIWPIPIDLLCKCWSHLHDGNSH